MWRGAHGRLAAIAIVGCGLCACASTPKAVETIDPDEKRDPGCGGNYPPVTAAEVLEAIEKAAHASCGAPAASAGRHGEIRVIVTRPNPEVEPRIQTELGSGGLADPDQRCVVAAVQGAFWSLERQYQHLRERWYSAKEVDLYIALGTPTPLFPSTQGPGGVIDRWWVATRSRPEHKRFEAKLPPGVTLEDDCVSMPSRPVFTDRLDRWLATLDTPFDPFWQRGSLTFAGLGPHGDRWSRAYLVGNRALLFHYPLATDRLRQEVCLLALDNRRRDDLRSRIERRATCWEGDLGEILRHPRTELPAGRRFKSVAVGQARVCAIDDSGTPVCCGERLTQDVPAGAFAAIAVGSSVDCGLTGDGSMRCWGPDAPEGGAVIAGPFARVAVGSRDACAIRRDTGALACWFSGEPGVVTFARGRFRDAGGLDDSLCALLEDGRISCRDADARDGWGDLAGRFRAFAANGASVCGVSAAGDAIQCWQRGWAGWQRSKRAAVAGPARPSDLALAGLDGCALGGAGQIACWRSKARDLWDGAYRMIAGSGGRICAVTVDGRVQCDRPWPSTDEPVAPAP